MSQPTIATTEGTAPVTPAPSTVSGEATSPQTAPVSTPAKVSVQEMIKGMTSEQRKLAAKGDFTALRATVPNAPASPSASAVVPAPAAAAPATPAAVPAVTPVSPNPSDPSTTVSSGGENPEGEIIEGEEGSRRFRISDKKDRALIQFAKAHNIPIAEAAARLLATAPAAPADGVTAIATNESATSPVVDPGIVQIQADLKSADAKLEKLHAERKKAVEELDQEKIIELSDKIGDVMADRKLLARDEKTLTEQTKARQEQAVTAKVDASREQAFKDFPVFAKEGTMHRLALDQFIQNEYNRDQSQFRTTDWPRQMAEKFATSNGITKGVAAASSPSVTPAPAPKSSAPLPGRSTTTQVQHGVTGVRLLSGADGHQGSANPMTRDDALALARTDPKGYVNFMKSQKR